MTIEHERIIYRRDTVSRLFLAFIAGAIFASSLFVLIRKTNVDTGFYCIDSTHMGLAIDGRLHATLAVDDCGHEVQQVKIEPDVQK